MLKGKKTWIGIAVAVIAALVHAYQAYKNHDLAGVWNAVQAIGLAIAAGGIRAKQERTTPEV